MCGREPKVEDVHLLKNKSSLASHTLTLWMCKMRQQTKKPAKKLISYHVARKISWNITERAETTFRQWMLWFPHMWVNDILSIRRFRRYVVMVFAEVRKFLFDNLGDFLSIAGCCFCVKDDFIGFYWRRFEVLTHQ